MLVRQFGNTQRRVAKPFLWDLRAAPRDPISERKKKKLRSSERQGSGSGGTRQLGDCHQAIKESLVPSWAGESTGVGPLDIGPREQGVKRSQQG